MLRYRSAKQGSMFVLHGDPLSRLWRTPKMMVDENHIPNRRIWADSTASSSKCLKQPWDDSPEAWFQTMSPLSYVIFTWYRWNLGLLAGAPVKKHGLPAGIRGWANLSGQPAKTYVKVSTHLDLSSFTNLNISAIWAWPYQSWWGRYNLSRYMEIPQ